MFVYRLDDILNVYTDNYKKLYKKLEKECIFYFKKKI